MENHYALLSVGSEIQGAFETVLQPLAITPIINEATALGISENQIEDFLVPVNEQGHPLYNPDLTTTGSFQTTGCTSRSTCRCTRAAITAMTSPSRPACRPARPRAGSGTARWCVFPAAQTQARACRTGARRRATKQAMNFGKRLPSFG